MDIVFGLDLSHHQDERLELARATREGIDFVILKATEGASFNDREFAGNLAEARAAGLLVAAYHYQRTDPVTAQVANVRDSVPLDVPVIPDVEAGSGSVALTRQLVDALRHTGYRVPLLYLPRWYWLQIGCPSLAGLPPLWSSRYPNNVVGSIQDEWDDVPAHYWNGYGGLDVAVLQFTSSAAIAGHQPLDANAYRGTRSQLAALFGGQEEDMGGELADAEVRFAHERTAAPGGLLSGKRLADIWLDTRIDVAAIRPMIAAIAAAVADGDLDPDVLGHRLEAASREAAEAGAHRAVVETVLPEVQRIREALEQDDASEARAIVTELAERLRPTA